MAQQQQQQQTVPQAREDKIKEELARLTTSSIEAFNTRDFTYTATPLRQDFLSRISPTFQANIERVKEPLDWAGLSDIWRYLAHTMPETKFNILNVSVDMRGYNRASVFLETSTLVQEGKVRWERVMEYKWYEIEGRWMCSGIVSISGSRGNSGMVD